MSNIGFKTKLRRFLGLDLKYETAKYNNGIIRHVPLNADLSTLNTQKSDAKRAIRRPSKSVQSTSAKTTADDQIKNNTFDEVVVTAKRIKKPVSSTTQRRINNSDEGKRVQKYQRMLQRAGLYNGAIDGMWGSKTQAAYEALQKQRNKLNQIDQQEDAWRQIDSNVNSNLQNSTNPGYTTPFASEIPGVNIYTPYRDRDLVNNYGFGYNTTDLSYTY